MKWYRKLAQVLVIWFLLGMCYATIELLYRGYTYRPMLLVGGLAGLCVGALNERPNFFARKMWIQCLTGTLITLAIEYVSGCILNLRLKRNIWDYCSEPHNLDGQVCLKTALMWFLLMPTAIWIDDFIRHKLFGRQPPPKSPWDNYLMLFRGK